MSVWGKGKAVTPSPGLCCCRQGWQGLWFTYGSGFRGGGQAGGVRGAPRMPLQPCLRMFKDSYRDPLPTLKGTEIGASLARAWWCPNLRTSLLRIMHSDRLHIQKHCFIKEDLTSVWYIVFEIFSQMCLKYSYLLAILKSHLYFQGPENLGYTENCLSRPVPYPVYTESFCISIYCFTNHLKKQKWQTDTTSTWKIQT